MTILIQGMKMPERGDILDILIFPNGEVQKRCSVNGFQLVQEASAVSVPTHHGRLIYADALMELYEPAHEDVNEWEHYTTTISVIRKTIKDQPTVIEAEGPKE